MNDFDPGWPIDAWDAVIAALDNVIRLGTNLQTGTLTDSAHAALLLQETAQRQIP